MTFSSVPYALQNGSHSADLFRQAASSLVPPGGGLVTPGDLAVTQTGTPSMNVSVGVGRCWIPGTNVGNVTGGNFSSQAMYYGQNPAAYTASVATSDPVNPRIDVVYASIQDSQYAGATNTGVIAVATGVPTSGAAYPANAPTLPANSLALAWINVGANVPSIDNAHITAILAPTISPVGYQHAEFTSAANLVPTATAWGMGIFSLDASQTTDKGFCTINATDKLQVTTAGLYSITMLLGFTATISGISWMSIDGSYTTTMGGGLQNFVTTLPNVRLAAGALIQPLLSHGSGSDRTFTGRVRVTRIR